VYGTTDKEADVGPISGLINLLDFIVNGIQALLAASPIPL
jgi:hypothetical protein